MDRRTDLKVHIGFGFHVNCYHSYRGDTNDVFGFGGDIRIIRHIIDTLDHWNQEGIPVKGTWDCENAYSLEKILPEYAPDIIEKIKRRQNENGDENILMGYNNGAMSAMTEDEFMASVQWAVSNAYGSGLNDIFGHSEPVIRPQEVMFTPSEARLYKKAGVKAVCLYYSCTPFDAFRTLIPPLSDEDAFNPIHYRYGDDSIVILPTYSNSDLMDAGSLRYLATDLHCKQISGEIKRDVFIFINIDADSFLWEPMAVPKFMQRWPNFGGIGGLIEEIKDLDFVEFNTPGGYLRNHEPRKEIFFGEDVADGNFTGYSSWAEKPFNRLIWSRLERARTMARVRGKDSESPSFESRIRLLSTTHFGLASPVMNIDRERKALELSKQMMEEEWQKDSVTLFNLTATNEQRITLLNTNLSACINVQLSVQKGICYDTRKIEASGNLLVDYVFIPFGTYEDGSVRSVVFYGSFKEHRNSYEVVFKIRDTVQGSENLKIDSISCGSIKVQADEALGLPLITVDDKQVFAWDSWIEYRKEKVHFGRSVVTGRKWNDHCESLEFSGEIHLPEELQPGKYCFTFFFVPFSKDLHLKSEIRYPYTYENHEISSQASNLGRYSDVGWTEVAPMELTLLADDNTYIAKRNFMGDISSYPLNDLWKAFPQSQNIEAMNHQLTGGFLGIHAKECNLSLIHSRNILGSMAHCPARTIVVDGQRKLSINPFGTYFGKQRYYPSRGNGCIVDMYNLTMPQARSLAPAYNGVFEQGLQILSLSGSASQDLLAFADGAVAMTGKGIFSPYMEDNVLLHEAQRMNVSAEKLGAVATTGNSKWPLVKVAFRYLGNMIRSNRKLHRLERKCK